MLDRTREKLGRGEPVTIVLYGDSISEVGRSPGYFGGASSAENNWGQVLGRMLNETAPHHRFAVRHFAIGGQNTYEGLGRLDWLAEHEPDLVIVAFGANDCGHQFIEPEATGRALRTLVEGISGRYGADVVIATAGGENPLEPTWRHPDETLAVQRQVAEETHSLLLDVRLAVLAATRDGKDWGDFHNGPQDCHPNDRGHEVWARAAFAVLSEALAL